VTADALCLTDRSSRARRPSDTVCVGTTMLVVGAVTGDEAAMKELNSSPIKG
jgi:hypothetical protein